MNISSGISEIGFNNVLTNRIASEKFYVWPQYNAGRIDKIHDVIHRTESTIFYTKPLPGDREKLLAMSKEDANHEYSSSGKINSASHALRPGSFFDAIV